MDEMRKNTYKLLPRQKSVGDELASAYSNRGRNRLVRHREDDGD